MKRLLTTLVLVSASLSSAQHSERPGTVPWLKDDSAATAVRPGKLNESLVIVPGEQEKLGESIFLTLPKERKTRQAESKSFASEFRKEINSLAIQLPDLSASWFGVSWYVRNPLRYKLSPGSTYEHQFGLSSGNWLLSVDGIGMSSLDNLDVAFQYPFGKNMSLLVRYSDMQYRLMIESTGKLPWE